MPAKLISSVPKLTEAMIRNAIHTVRVRASDHGWTVKKVAHPKVWKFARKEEAIARATEIAKAASWSVVIHNKNGKVIQRVHPSRSSKSSRGQAVA